MFKELKEFGIAHIGFVVKDRDATVEKFKDMFNIDDFVEYVFTPSRVWSYGELVNEYSLKIAMADVLGHECKIEIIEPLSGDGVHKKFVDSGNSGIHHIAFSVDNYDYWVDYFKNKGVDFVFESETEDDVKGYRRCFYAEDKVLGTVYEIMEKPYFRKK